VNKYRKGAERYIEPVANAFVGWNPNNLTWMSLVVAILAGTSIYLSGNNPLISGNRYPLLFIGALLILLSSMFDALDGAVARRRGMQSPQGDYLDHVLDRMSDVVVFIGISLSSLCDDAIGLISVIVILLASYMGTQAQAVGAGRDYSGFGRADRIILVTGGVIFQGFASIFGWDILGWTILELVMIILAILSGYTIIVRGRAAWKELDGPAVSTDTQGTPSADASEDKGDDVTSDTGTEEPETDQGDKDE